MSVSAPLPKDHPLSLAWLAHTKTDEFSNSRRWAQHAEHVDGSLWALFMAGWQAAGGTLAAQPTVLPGHGAQEPERHLDAFIKWAAGYGLDVDESDRDDRMFVHDTTELCYLATQEVAGPAPEPEDEAAALLRTLAAPALPAQGAPRTVEREVMERIVACVREWLGTGKDNDAPRLEIAGIASLAEAVLSTPPTASQPVVGAVQTITAKPVEWVKHNAFEWSDNRYGFFIQHTIDADEEPTFTAVWGEGDSERFASLEGAKAWCQREIDQWAAEIAVVAPAAPKDDAAPVAQPVALTQAQAHKLLWDAWCKAEPTHSITLNPVSYVQAFADMARAILAAAEAKPAEPSTAEFEVCDESGVCLAAADGPRALALAEAMRYAEQYASDGPVTVFEVIRCAVSHLAAASKEPQS